VSKDEKKRMPGFWSMILIGIIKKSESGKRSRTKSTLRSRNNKTLL
jgi:hypothetical protein